MIIMALSFIPVHTLAQNKNSLLHIRNSNLQENEFNYNPSPILDIFREGWAQRVTGLSRIQYIINSKLLNIFQAKRFLKGVIRCIIFTIYLVVSHQRVNAKDQYMCHFQHLREKDRLLISLVLGEGEDIVNEKKNHGNIGFWRAIEKLVKGKYF